MTETLVTEPAMGAVDLFPPDWRALLDLTRPGRLDADPEEGSDGPDCASTLEAAGLLSEGQLLAPVARAMAAVRNPSCRFSVATRGLEAQGWLDAGLAALLLPVEAGLLELTWVPAAFLPDVLARLVELGPRPIPDGPPLRLTPGSLAHLLAAPDDYAPLPGADPSGSRGQESRARRLLASVTRHWRIEARTIADAGPGQPRSLEALDTPDGSWRLFADAGCVELRPTSPTRLWRLLTVLSSASEERWGLSER